MQILLDVKVTLTAKAIQPTSISTYNSANFFNGDIYERNRKRVTIYTDQEVRRDIPLWTKCGKLTYEIDNTPRPPTKSPRLRKSALNARSSLFTVNSNKLEERQHMFTADPILPIPYFINFNKNSIIGARWRGHMSWAFLRERSL